MTDTLTVVLVGCGAVSHHWLTARQETPGLVVVGLVDLATARAEARRSEFGLTCEVHASLSHALAKHRPDLVFDCTTAESRLEVALAALAAGCHVLVEKPLAPSLDAARAIVARATAASKLYATMQNYRYQSGCRRLARFLRSGAIGDITACATTFSVGAHFSDFRQRMAHPLLLDMAIHTFDMARLFLPELPATVYCKEWNPPGSWYASGANTVALFETDGGVVYTYQGSWCAEGVRTSWAGEWRITGTLGSVIWDGLERFHAEVVAGGGVVWKAAELPVPPLDSSDRIGGHAGAIADFVDCVHTGRAPETICTDNVRTLAMVLSAIESAERGQVVPLPRDLVSRR